MMIEDETKFIDCQNLTCYVRCMELDPGVGQNVALHAAPADRAAPTCMVSAFQIQPPSLFPKTSPIVNMQSVECVINSESE